jgi:hypothetical protein
MFTPALVIDEEVVVSGRVPKKTNALVNGTKNASSY